MGRAAILCAVPDALGRSTRGAEQAEPFDLALAFGRKLPRMIGLITLGIKTSIEK
jgi:hypothetical protein